MKESWQTSTANVDPDANYHSSLHKELEASLKFAAVVRSSNQVRPVSIFFRYSSSLLVVLAVGKQEIGALSPPINVECGF